MNSGLVSRLLAAVALCMSNGVFAAEPEIPSKAGAEPKSASTRTATDKPRENARGLFSKPAIFRGTLGDMPIQFALRPKEIIDEGLEGEYFIFGRPQKILLAGDLEGEIIFLEESENGTNISGQWEGILQGDSIQGTWKSADESVSRPFKLKLIRVHANVQKPRPVRKASSADATSAASR